MLSPMPIAAEAGNAGSPAARTSNEVRTMSKITTKDGTEIYYKDWGNGRPVVFSHGWPLNANAWDDQIFFLASRGFRCIAFDRRGFRPCSQPWDGNDYDTYADDLSAVIEALDLKGIAMVGHSAGAGDITRYIGRYGARRVYKAVLVSSIPPLMLKTLANPGGLPIEVFDGIRASLLKDRAQFYLDLAGPFYGANRPRSKKFRPGYQGCSLALVHAGRSAGLVRRHQGILRDELHGGPQEDRRPNFNYSWRRRSKRSNRKLGAAVVNLIKKATLKVYPGARHGLMVTHKDQFNNDLLAFIQT